MKIEGEGKRVTVYVGSADTWGGHNLAMAIVERCREMGLAGATVSRGVMGFGKHSVIHKAHLLGLSDDLPEKIEVVDRPEEIERLLPVLDQMIGGGLDRRRGRARVRYLHELDHGRERENFRHRVSTTVPSPRGGDGQIPSLRIDKELGCTRTKGLFLLKGGEPGISESNRKVVAGNAHLDLSGSKLSAVKLRWGQLSGADLSQSDLNWADLSRAKLNGAKLRREEPRRSQAPRRQPLPS